MFNYFLQNSLLYIYVLHYSVLQCTPMSTVSVLQLAPMLLQLNLTGGKLQHIRRGHISLHHIANIDYIYLKYILCYTGETIYLLDKMTSFIKVIITCRNTKMLKILQLAPLPPV